MARAAYRQEVKVVLVARHVASHALLAVRRPRPPRLNLLEANVRCPVLAPEGIDARVGVAAVDQHADLVLGARRRGLTSQFVTRSR